MIAANERKQACRVLMVEDHADTVAVMGRLLRKLGYTVDTAGSAAEARVKFMAAPPDVLIIDLVLPDGEGTDLLGELRAMGSCRAVAFSGLAMEADRRRTQAAGFDAHLVKPATIDAIDAAVRQACGASS